MNIYTVFVSDPDNAVTLLKAFSSENRAREYLTYAARLKYNELQILQRQGLGEENYGGTITNLQFEDDDDGEDTKDSIFISYTSNYIDWWGNLTKRLLSIDIEYRVQSMMQVLSHSLMLLLMLISTCNNISVIDIIIDYLHTLVTVGRMNCLVV